jgi:Flp pilus assembly protein TadG
MTLSLPRFLRAQDGGASIELIVVLPVFLLIVGLIVDSSMLLLRQGQAYRVIQDANRNMSIGRFASPEETSAFVIASLDPVAPGTTAESIVTNGVIVTMASLPIAGIQITGLLSAFDEGTIGVTATHVLER